MKDQVTKKLKKINLAKDGRKNILVSENSEYLLLLNIDEAYRSAKDIELYLIFEKPNIVADITMRLVLRSNTSVKVSLTVRAPQGIKNVSSSLDMSGLILSDGGTINFIPSLEIDELDASVDHKSTLGYPDQDIMSYMMSRGLEKEQIYSLLSDAFFDKI